MAFNPDAFNKDAYRTPWLLGRARGVISRVSKLVATVAASPKAVAGLTRRSKPTGEIERE